MKKLFVLLFLLALSGCRILLWESGSQRGKTSQCPKAPEIDLNRVEPRSISLNQGTVTKSGTVGKGRLVAYSFQAQAGQTLHYATAENICVWLYDSAHQQVTPSHQLTQNGRYILQVSALQGTTSFELTMSLDAESLSSTTMQQSQKPSTQHSSAIYNVEHAPTLNQSWELQTVVNELVTLARRQGLSATALSITLIDLNTNEFAQYQEDRLRYPASVVKLFWMVIAYAQIEAGTLHLAPELSTDLKKMMVQSDNEASSRILDKITGTTSETGLSDAAFRDWKTKRLSASQFFRVAEYDNIYISQKTFPIPYLKLYEPKGADLKIRGDDPNRPIRNKITTGQAARLMYEIVKGQAVSLNASKEMKILLDRQLRSATWKHIKPNSGEFNPVRTFFGEHLPADTILFSKAGWTSATRQEVAFVRTPDGKMNYILAIFAEDAKYAKNPTIFPNLSRRAFQLMTARSAPAIAKPIQRPPTVTPAPTPTSQVPAPVAPQPRHPSRSQGWIRLGAIDKTYGSYETGEALIDTKTQFVSITPARVPRVRDRVTVTTPINIRESFPPEGTYKLPKKVGGYRPEQTIVIHRIEGIVDPNSSSPNINIWAEVGLP